MTQSSEKVKSVLDAKLWITGIILVIVSSVVFTLLTGFMTRAGRITTMGQNILGVPSGIFLLLALFWLANWFFPSLRYDPRRITILSAMMAVTLTMAGYQVPWNMIGDMLQYRVYGAHGIPPDKQFLPSFWAPSNTDVFQAMIRGGVPVPWGDWMTPMLFWTIYLVVISLMTLSFNSLMRRRWLDEESLSFPNGLVMAQMVDLCTASTSGDQSQVKLLRTKRLMFSAGMLITIIYYLPYFLRIGWPGLPDIYGWYKSPPYYGWGGPCLDLFAAGVRVPAAMLTVHLGLMYWALFYVTTLDVSLTAWVAWIVGLVILPSLIFQFTGFYEEWLGDPAHGSIDHGYYIANHPPLLYWMVAWWGMVFAIAIIPCILHWDYFKRLWDSIVRGPTSEEKENEIMPARTALIIFIVSWLILVAMSTLLNGNVLPILWTFILLIFMMLTYGRVRGEAGVFLAFWGYSTTTYWPFYSHIYANPADQASLVTAEYETTTHLNHYLISEVGLVYNRQQYQLDVIRMAKSTATKLSDILLPTIIASVLSILISFPVALYSYYQFGFNNVPIHGDGMWWTWTSHPNFAAHPPVTTGDAIQGTLLPAIAGFIIGAIFIVLRTRYARFPFNVVGLLLGITNVTIWYGLGFAAFMGWLGRYITMKIGGSRLYEQRGLPFATGVIAGEVIMYLIGMLLSYYRFFVPL